jgi:ATP-binding cassette, subfamily B, bacterial
MTDRPSRRARSVRSRRLIGPAIGLYLRAAPVAVAVRVFAVVVTGLGPVAIAWFAKAMIDGLTTHRVGVVGPTVAAAGTGGAMALVQHLAGFADREVNRRVAVLTTARLFAAVNRQIGIEDPADPTYHDRLRWRSRWRSRWRRAARNS